MMYIVLEIQKNPSGQIGTLINAYESLNVAYQKYYLVLSAAAVSELPVHSAMLIKQSGETIAYKSFVQEEEENIE